jgi:hypothetical protein
MTALAFLLGAVTGVMLAVIAISAAPRGNRSALAGDHLTRFRP